MRAVLAVRDDGLGLRRALRGDVAAIVALLADDPIGAGRETAPPAGYDEAFARIDADARELLAVVVDGPTVIGTFQLTTLPGLSRGGSLRAQIEAVRVATDRRGEGIGRWMLGWAVEEARRLGCSLVQLTADRQRTEAHRFYRELGFVASHEGFKLQL